MEGSSAAQAHLKRNLSQLTVAAFLGSERLKIDLGLSQTIPLQQIRRLRTVTLPTSVRLATLGREAVAWSKTLFVVLSRVLACIQAGA